MGRINSNLGYNLSEVITMNITEQRFWPFSKNTKQTKLWTYNNLAESFKVHK